MKNTASFSRCRQYRYALWRTWDNTKPHVLFVGLNPSTADEKKNDPTITRCIDFAKRWGYGGVCVANLFAYRSTKPSGLKSAAQPVGKQNNRWLKKLAKEAGLVVAAWGNDGSFMNRSKEVINILPRLNCLNINRSGEPAHPLYQKASTLPKPMEEKIYSTKDQKQKQKHK